MAIEKDRVMAELQVASTAEGVRTIMSALVREIGSPRELSDGDYHDWYSIVVEAFYQFNRLHVPHATIPYQEFGNSGGFGLNSMNLDSGNVLYSKGELRRVDEPTPAWLENLANIRTATSRDEY